MRGVTLIAVLLTMLMISCSSPYKYFGKSYEETVNPEMFFRPEDIPKDYEEMGKLEVVLPSKTNMERIQKNVVKIAGEHGADVVLIDNFDLETGGFTSVSGRGGKKDKEGNNYNFGTQTTDVEKDIVVKATLVKFKENIQR